MTTPPQPTTTHVPFLLATQLNHDSSSALAIRHGIQNTEADWHQCLAADLETKLIDIIHPWLWVVAKKSGTHIDALHKQVIKTGTIVAVEDPRLHLVWYYKTIFVKPLPDYLLNHAIWTQFIQPATPVPLGQQQPRYDRYRTAIGFLRSYACLIRHESDYIIAQRANLLPKYVSFDRFQKFIYPFRFIEDVDVSSRYEYGQLRLNRLNAMMHAYSFARAVHAPCVDKPVPWAYHQQNQQIGQFLRSYTAPFIFVFAMCSLILSSMQVALQARGPDTWKVFERVSWGFSVATIIFCAVLIVGAVMIVVLILVYQGQFALRMKWKTMRSRP
jgi:hypothetical protein